MKVSRLLFAVITTIFSGVLVSCGDESKDIQIKNADEFINRMKVDASSRVKNETLANSTECIGSLTLAKKPEVSK